MRRATPPPRASPLAAPSPARRPVAAASSSSAPLYLGLDLGTSGGRAAVVDGKRKEADGGGRLGVAPPICAPKLV